MGPKTICLYINGSLNFFSCILMCPSIFFVYINGSMNIFIEYFSEKHPARSVVQVSALPMGARIEIDAIRVVE